MGGRLHRCDERCVCPEHGIPLIYWPAGDDHACQDTACIYSAGMNDELLVQSLRAPAWGRRRRTVRLRRDEERL